MHVTYPDVVVDARAPDTLDLSHLRGCGLQPGEEELPEGDTPANQQEEKPGTAYVLIYRTLLIIPDTFLGNFRCSNTTDTLVLYICSKYPDNTLKS